MPFIRSSASKCFTYCFKLVAVILLLSKIIPTYLQYAEKGLIYITIMALFSRQPSSYVEYTKSNIRSSCNVYLVFNTEYAFLTRLYFFLSLQLSYLICLRVLYNNYYKKA